MFQLLNKYCFNRKRFELCIFSTIDERINSSEQAQGLGLRWGVGSGSDLSLENSNPFLNLLSKIIEYKPQPPPPVKSLIPPPPPIPPWKKKLWIRGWCYDDILPELTIDRDNYVCYHKIMT